MTIEASALRELHRLHRQISDLRSRLERGPRQIAALDNNLKRLVEAVAAAKQTYQRTRITINEKELQLREREGRMLDVRGRLNSCSSNREYQAYMEQIAADEQANSVLSDEIIELLDKAASDQDAVKTAEANQQHCAAELAKLTERVESEHAGLESELGRVDRQLKEAELVLPSDVRADYQRVAKAHGEEALAPLEGECCGGCFQRVTPQMLNELTMSKAVFCKSCGRLLYLPEETSA